MLMQSRHQIKEGERHQEHGAQTEEFRGIGVAKVEDIQAIQIPIRLIFHMHPDDSSIAEHIENVNDCDGDEQRPHLSIPW